MALENGSCDFYHLDAEEHIAGDCYVRAGDACGTNNFLMVEVVDKTTG
jgi:hypothetical protein